MAYYISAFLIYYIAVIYRLQNGARHHGLTFIIGLALMVFLVLLRGNVGTDTVSYIQIISDIRDTGSSGVEIGFVLLVKALLYLGAEPRLILVLVAAITTAMLIFASLLSERALLVSMLCVVPIFYLDMTMNGLRYGLSFACAMNAIALFYRNRFVGSAFLGICAVMFHIFSLLLFAIMLLFADGKDEVKRWLALTAGLALVVFVQQYLGEIKYFFMGIQHSKGGVDIAGKASFYWSFPSPSRLSGLVPLTLSIIVAFIIRAADQVSTELRSRRFYALLALIAMTFIVAKISYAGLRLQFVLLFAMLVALQFKPKFAGVVYGESRRGMLHVMVFIGILGVAAFLKNALISEGQGLSPWLPYTINPHIRDLLVGF